MTHELQPVTEETTALRRLVVWRGAVHSLTALKRERKAERNADTIAKCAAAESLEWKERNRLLDAANKLKGQP